MSERVRQYLVVSPLQHDLQNYPIGSKVTLSPEQAAPLLGHTIKEAKALSARDLIDAKASEMKGGAQ
jgi:hypothetical protein